MEGPGKQPQWRALSGLGKGGGEGGGASHLFTNMKLPITVGARDLGNSIAQPYLRSEPTPERGDC